MPHKFRNTFITVFVILWTIVFHYESIRHFYLQPFFDKPLPKVKFLFPPAGWIMFYSVGDGYGSAEIYGVRNGQPQLIDPHDILTTRFIGFDNIKRNVLSSMLDRSMKDDSCRFLQRKFPEFEQFVVTAVEYPSVTKRPRERLQAVVYQCP